jgi:transcription antitermination factor NusA-like protein
MTNDEIHALIKGVVPEIRERLVSIERIAHAPGIHTLLLVKSHDPDVDGVGALLGPRGRYIEQILRSLGGTIGIVPWMADCRSQITLALGALTAERIEIDSGGATTLHNPIYRQDPDREKPNDAAFVGTLVALAAELIGGPIATQGALTFRPWNAGEKGLV